MLYPFVIKGVKTSQFIEQVEERACTTGIVKLLKACEDIFLQMNKTSNDLDS